MTARGARTWSSARSPRAGVRHLFSLSGNQILSRLRRDHRPRTSASSTRATRRPPCTWPTRGGGSAKSPGVALVTAGPGHLNALSALYGALMAESPVVLLSGHAPRGPGGPRRLSRRWTRPAAAAPVTKASWVAKDAARLGEDITLALELARSGRPGPVHVSLPGDLLDAKVERAARAARAPRVPRGSMPAAEADLRRLLELLEGARRPLVLLGPAMARPARARRRRAPRRGDRRAGAPDGEPARRQRPVAAHGGAAPRPRPTSSCSSARRLDFAVRFGGAPPFDPACRFVQVGLGRRGARPERPRQPRARHRSGASGRAARRRGAAGAGVGATWGDEVAAARASVPAEWEGASPIGSGRPCIRCASARRSSRCSTAAPSSSPTAASSASGSRPGCEAGTRLINGLSGSIGSALPMALAARLRHPDRPVIAALGDGTFGFHAFELDTAASRRAARRWPWWATTRAGTRSTSFSSSTTAPTARWRCELRPSRYDLMAAALGGHGEHVERPDDLGPALERALASGLPACVNVMIDGVAAPTYRAACARPLIRKALSFDGEQREVPRVHVGDEA